MRKSSRWAIAGLAMIAVVGLAQASAQPAAQVRTFSRTDPKGEVTISVTVRGAGPLVVLVPSLGRSGADFEDLAGKIAKAGFMTASLDPRGVGASRGPTEALTLFDYAEDAAMVARGLSDQPAVFIGHAHGNRVVRAVAARHPEQVSRLILLASGGAAPMAPQVLSAFNKVFDPSLPADQHLAAVKAAFFAPDQDPKVWAGGWYPDAAKLQNKASANTPNGEWANAGAAPVLIVQAADDLVAVPANADVLKAAHPDRVTVVTIPDAGHAMLPEQPKLIAEIVIGYLKAH